MPNIATTTPKSDVIIHIKKPFTPTSICIFLCPKSIVKDEGFCLLLLVRISSFPSRFPWEIPISTLFFFFRERRLLLLLRYYTTFTRKPFRVVTQWLFSVCNLLLLSLKSYFFPCKHRIFIKTLRYSCN